MNAEEAAEILHILPREIRDVVDSPAGPLITTTRDEQTYLVCEVPDAEGKTGLMFASPPVPNYRGTFPVYAPEDGAEAITAADGADAGDAEGDDDSEDEGEPLDKDALVAIAEERDIPIDKRWSADRIAEAITAADGADAGDAEGDDS